MNEQKRGKSSEGNFEYTAVLVSARRLYYYNNIQGLECAATLSLISISRS